MLLLLLLLLLLFLLLFLLLLLLLLLPKGSVSGIYSYLHLPQKSTNYLPTTFPIKKTKWGHTWILWVVVAALLFNLHLLNPFVVIVVMGQGQWG